MEIIKEYINEDTDIINEIGRLIDNNYQMRLNESSKCYVAVIDDTVIGFIQFNILYDIIEITDIAVKQEFQSRNIGSKLLKCVEEFANLNNKIQILLECRYMIVPFYEKNGYIINGLRKSYYQNPVEDAYLLIKELK